MDTPGAKLDIFCRLCAQEQDATITLFGEAAASDELRHKIKTYLDIEVKQDDNLPKNICINCCTKLHAVCNYVQSVRQAQETLLNLVTVPQKPEALKLQNKGIILSSKTIKGEKLTYLNGADGENVTLMLIGKESSNAKNLENEDFDHSVDILKPFYCTVCKKRFCTDIALKNHTWTHFTKVGSIKPFKCVICMAEFDFKFQIATHSRQHKDSCICSICNRAFRSQWNLTKHMAIHNSRKKSYTCVDCSRTYSTLSSFKTHRITHSNERPYPCNFCKKRFKRYQELRFHINKHTGDKPYKCPVCGKGFASSGNCYSHKARMHSSQHKKDKKRKDSDTNADVSLYFRPIAPKTQQNTPNSGFKYECQLCSHTFNKRENFMYHMYKHTGEKPFNCLHCPEKFVTRKGLHIHYKNNHPEKDRPLTLISKNVLLK